MQNEKEHVFLMQQMQLKESGTVFLLKICRRHARDFFEYNGKVVWIHKAAGQGGFIDGGVFLEHFLCFGNAQIVQVFFESCACELLEGMAYIGLAALNVLAYLSKSNGFCVMLLNVIKNSRKSPKMAFCIYLSPKKWSSMLKRNCYKLQETTLQIRQLKHMPC